MADITKIKLPNGSTYNVKDTISGYTTNIGTVTQVKVGITAYDPSSGVVSLPAYPTATDSNPTLAWGTKSKVATVCGTDINVTMPDNPNTDIEVRQKLITTNYNRPLLMSSAQTSSETSNIDNIVYRNNSIFANPSTGRITSTNLTVGISADNATFPNGAIRCYDVRNVTSVPTTEGANFIMTNEGSPISRDWYSGIYVKSSGGEYGVWELVGPALNADNRTKPLYVRSSNKTTAWGDWRKIYDSANPPTASDVGALASTTKYALSDSVGGDALNSAKVGGYTIGTTPVGSASTGTAIPADDITSWTTNTPTAVTPSTVVTSASYSSGILTLNTGDSCTVTAGASANLQYTPKSIPNISVSSVTVATAT